MTYKKTDSTGSSEPDYIEPYKAVFPVKVFEGMKMTLDGKKEIPGPVDRYMRHIREASDLSAEEIMYLVKRVGDLESAMAKLRDMIRNYE